jgi:transcriptional regulator with XRE-family HTH domain
MMTLEPGYTPANLRAVILALGLTQQATADLLKVDVVTLRRWLMPLSMPSHRDMPYAAWLRLINLLPTA